MSAVFVLLLTVACSHARAHGVVQGHFVLPGRAASDVQRGGLNFASGDSHGNGEGHTARVNSDGSYSISLPAGSYSVIGALSGEQAGPVPESCAETLTVTVTAGATTDLDFVCHAAPSSLSTS